MIFTSFFRTRKIFDIIRYVIVGIIVITIFDTRYNNGKLSESDFSCHNFLTTRKKDDENLLNLKIKEYSKSDYKILIEDLKNATNKLILFPNDINNSTLCEGMYYLDRVYEDWGLDWRAEIYFHIQYAKEEFEYEVERLSNVHISLTDHSSNNENNTITKYPLVTEDYFSLKSFVATYNDESRFEYSLIKYDTCEIIHIYIFDVGKAIKNIPKEYTPTIDFEKYNVYHL